MRVMRRCKLANDACHVADAYNKSCLGPYQFMTYYIHI